eukprot:TRINITY_DN6302_c0_g1_i4.p1 TRINITY_DN6302_c0_g1~~TRINITY_DN6302_c0_g1_i4.p1  ORF type:complete len:110 (-),score=15.34 TRINITY_DN6302_c0_g1_i4:51-380(-)
MLFLILAASLVPLIFLFFFLMIRRPPRSTLSSSSAASDVYKRQVPHRLVESLHCSAQRLDVCRVRGCPDLVSDVCITEQVCFVGHHPLLGTAVLLRLSLIHISEPTRPY